MKREEMLKMVEQKYSVLLKEKNYKIINIESISHIDYLKDIKDFKEFDFEEIEDIDFHSLINRNESILHITVSPVSHKYRMSAPFVGYFSIKIEKEIN